MPQSVIHEMLYMKHPTRLKILQGVFLCSDIYVTSPETGAEDFSEITDRFPQSSRCIRSVSDPSGTPHLEKLILELKINNLIYSSMKITIKSNIESGRYSQ